MVTKGHPRGKDEKREDDKPRPRLATARGQIGTPKELRDAELI
jgi:hypothetical protein